MAGVPHWLAMIAIIGLPTAVVLIVATVVVEEVLKRRRPSASEQVYDIFADARAKMTDIAASRNPFNFRGW